MNFFLLQFHSWLLLCGSAGKGGGQATVNLDRIRNWERV